MDLGLARRLTAARIPLLRPRCSSRNDKGDTLPPDWDKAWATFRKQKGKKKKKLFSEFRPDKYVSWNPRPLDYPLSEEVDPIRRTERFNLSLWTSPQFTLAGAIAVVSLLLVYTLLFPLE